MKLSIALPAYNEEQMLPTSVPALVAYCRDLQASRAPLSFEVVIADNGSTDHTAEVSRALAAQFPEVRYLQVPRRGKGAAIRAAWESAAADVYVFMDADLATDLSVLPALLAGMSQGSDLVAGSRVHPRSVVERTAFRKLLSAGYRFVVRALLGVTITDAPCGCKAINERVKQEVVPRVEHPGWFFDSELIVRAQRAGYRVTEVPVQWRDPREGNDRSRVQVVSLSFEYLKEVLRLRRQLSVKLR